MYIFFLIINLIFSWVFYLFEGKIEALLFFFIWVLMFFYFSPMYFTKKENKNSVLSKIAPSKQSLKKIIPLFQKISYLLAFLFFYISLYGISYYFWGQLFSYFTLLLNIFTITLFFVAVNKQKLIVNLIYRSNFLVFSFIGIFLFVYKLINSQQIDIIFVINSILSLFWLLTTLIFDKLLESPKKKIYYVYFSIYLLMFIIFYIQYYFGLKYILFLSYLWFIMSIFYFDVTTKIKQLSFYDDVSKYLGIFLNYFTIICAWILLYTYINFWHFVLILLGWIIFHYYIHFVYKNYISLAIVLISIILIYTKNFIIIWKFWFEHFIIFIYLLPFVYLGYSFFFQNKYQYDNYLVIFSWLIFSIFSILTYFYLYRDTNILHLSIILLLQSFLLFWGFVKLKTK